MIGNDKKNDKKNDKEIDKNGLSDVSFLSINSDGNLCFLAFSLNVENLFSSDFYVTVIDENEETESYENGKRVNDSNENLNNKNNNIMMTDRQTHRKTDTNTDRQTDRNTDRQTDRNTSRQ